MTPSPGDNMSCSHRQRHRRYTKLSGETQNETLLVRAGPTVTYLAGLAGHAQHSVRWFEAI